MPAGSLLWLSKELGGIETSSTKCVTLLLCFSWNDAGKCKPLKKIEPPQVVKYDYYRSGYQIPPHKNVAHIDQMNVWKII